MNIYSFNKILKRTLLWSAIPVAPFYLILILEDIAINNALLGDILIHTWLLLSAFFLVGLAYQLYTKKFRNFAINVATFFIGLPIVVSLMFTIYLVFF